MLGGERRGRVNVLLELEMPRGRGRLRRLACSCRLSGLAWLGQKCRRCGRKSQGFVWKPLRCCSEPRGSWLRTTTPCGHVIVLDHDEVWQNNAEQHVCFGQT
jgi:hypothetical protein